MKVQELFESKKSDEGWYVVTRGWSMTAIDGPHKTEASAKAAIEDADDERVVYGYPKANETSEIVRCAAPVAEAYEAPVRNKKLGFNPTAKIPTGGTKEWLATFKATPQDVEQALRQVRQSAAYRAIKSLGLSDSSNEGHARRGSIMFTGHITVPAANGRTRDRRIKLTVQPNGKIDETAPNDWHRYPMASGKPRIVPGDPAGSIQKTMEAALEKMASILEKRFVRAKKDVVDAQKAYKKLLGRND